MIPEYRFPLKRKCGFLHIGTPVSNLRNWGVKPPGILIFRRLREHGYDSKLMKLYIVGGGGCMIRNFAEYNERRITVNDDICATAKGYERMLEMKLIKNGGAL